MLKIRQVQSQDYKEIAKIYAYWAKEAIVTFDHEGLSCEAWRLKGEKLLQQGYPFFVLEEIQESTQEVSILGFCYASSFRDKPAYAQSWEATIYLSSSALGRRLGEKLFRVLEQAVQKAGASSLLSLIGVEKGQEIQDNASCRLHEKLGYKFSGRLEEVGYKFDRFIDVVLYQKIFEPYKKGEGI